jgi:hypothetical protein
VQTGLLSALGLNVYFKGNPKSRTKTVSVILEVS